MMKILVTGANGQLGMALRNEARENPGFDFLFTDLEDLDITNYHAVEDAIKDWGPDAIVNAASYNAVDQAEDDPMQALRINGRAVQDLAGLARKYNCGLIHVSTDYVFDGRKGSAYNELDEPHPRSRYAHSKLIGEQALHTAAPKAALIRTSWLYSEFGHNFVKTIRRLAAERDELKVVNDQFGTPTYAGDLAAAILKIIPEIGKFSGVRTYHYSNEGLTNWAEFAEAVVVYSRLKCRIIPVSTKEYGLSKAERPAYSLLDKSKVRQDFDLEIPEWRTSLKICIHKLENQNK